MKEYLNIINDDIKRFIENYLIGGLLDGITGMSDLEEYIPSKYPHLSILYLLKRNSIDSYIMDFISMYELKLKEETDDLHKMLGHFLCDKQDLEDINTQLSETALEKENLSTKVQELESYNESLSDQLSKSEAEAQSLTRKVEILTHEKGTLTSQNKNLTYENLQLMREIDELKAKLASHSSHEADFSNSSPERPITTTPEPYPTISDEGKIKNASPKRLDTNLIDTVDMGTSVLWCKKNLGADRPYDIGDYYSWGELKTRSFFSSSAFLYNRVDSMNISGKTQYDASVTALGEGYRIPTLEEWKDLLKVCGNKVKTVSIKRRKYIKLISEITGNQLLLPAMGHMEGENIHDENIAEYWSSCPYSGKSALIFWAKDTNWNTPFDAKWHGLPIRPVYGGHPDNEKGLGDIGTKFQVYYPTDRMREIAEESGGRIKESMKRAFASFFEPYSTDIHRKAQSAENDNKLNTKISSARNITVDNKYPSKDQININNVFSSIIKDCIPYGINVFENDKIANSELDLDKLNKILITQYNVDPISESSYQRLTFGKLKKFIVLRLKK